MPTTRRRDYTAALPENAPHFGYSFLPGLLFVALMWLVSLLSYLTGADLAFLGIRPRTFLGLIGVFLGPLIHGDLLHLLSNTFPLLLLSGFILYMHRRVASKVIVLVYLLSGLLTWVVGRQAYHIGASGVVYGLAGFLLFNGFLRQHRGAMAVSLAILFLYSGLFYGLFPGEERVSWEGHVAGLVSGLVAAIAYGEGKPEPTGTQPLAPDVVQRHMSSTIGPHYQHMFVSYTVGPEPQGQLYTYTFNANAISVITPTKGNGATSKDKRKASTTYERETERRKKTP
ncbi:rhomboid family intramembrane serine protease [Pontibacter mangrovi]|uniref:Rhomboid family intramembrane serine protease n=1 Tax=Pontibacter mangrovi TaxID=2589816 RepID=A0A501W8F3_9BACT|nr:rhomboid family intramembrane serine protease [Pontibacter mangrovi]TPE43097.1 rhomboid family intramembrane serine protease [Pontibacter mangrovi]